jgi:hypothetical protein
MKRDQYRKKPLPPTDELIAELRFLYSYDADNGGFIWIRRNKPGQRLPGSKVGGPDGRGYQMCMLLGHKFKVHQLVWLWHHGELSAMQLDHINGQRSDNRIENLRECDYSLNQHNRQSLKQETAGYRVCRKTGKFRAKIVVRGTTIELGGFERKEDARAAYVEAKKKYLGAFSPC